MNGALGSAGVSLGFLSALGGVGVLLWGLLSGRAALLLRGRFFAWGVGAGAVMAAFAMERALITHDFSLAYVATNGSRSTPLLYTVASLWGALQGSIILWSLVLSGYLLLVLRHFRKRLSDPMVGWATLVMLVVAAFFFALMLGPADPFRAVHGLLPTDGPGPNPLLQNHPLMAIHPPMLYLGYVGFVVPFAFAVAALVTGRLGEGWLVETRRWTLLAWGFLTVGIVLGSWWSYEVLGWGGVWAWDPVENASFLPWLTATAYLHSVMVQERRGMLRIWNLSLVMSTFALTIFGTFLTRSGVLESVHSFTRSAIGPLLLGFFIVVVAVSVGLMAWRGDRLRSVGSIGSPVSKEGSFLANNIVFATFAFMVLLGTIFPQLVEAVKGSRISVGRPYFDSMAIPLGLGLLFLMAVGPVLPWHRATGEVLRRRLVGPAWMATAAVVVALVAGGRDPVPLLAFGLGGFAAGTALRQLATAVRRHHWGGLVGRTNGGMIVHLGVVVMAVALVSSGSYGRAAEFHLRPGQSASLARHRVTYLGVSTTTSPRKDVTTVRIRVDGGQIYAPKLTKFPFSSQAIGTPSVRSRLLDDVYLTLVSTPPDPGGVASIGVIIQPLIFWLWFGGGVIAIGAVLAGVSRRRGAGAGDQVREAKAQTKAVGGPPADADATPALAGVTPK